MLIPHQSPALIRDDPLSRNSGMMDPVGIYSVWVLLKLILTHRIGGQNDSGGGYDSHMTVMGVLVVSLRGVNCRFWSYLGYSGQKANFFTHKGIA